ncbi:prephenate dehydrogenase [Lachnospiraceae bacterium]|nr:prephenate dehydrogenase [Lachnospiraceae bacterium]
MENGRLKVGFIALGLIGGSIAMTIRKKYPDAEIVALNRSDAPLDSALADGIIQYGTHTVDDHFANCDYIFLCAPVSTNIRYLKDLLPYISDKTILTDVGSVKSEIHEAISEIAPDLHFIGGHPMAGSEKSGYENANDHLIENAYFILTPSPSATQEDVSRYEEFVRSLDSIPLTLSPDQHDFVTAAISHLPHMIAYALVDMVRETDSPEQYMRSIAAGGFKDITRIASSDPTMWEQICMANPEYIIKLMDIYQKKLTGLREMIAGREGEKLMDLFDRAKQYRNSLSDTNVGAIPRIYDLHCDIIDEAGAIATIATILSTHSVSLRNIGIVHNRTYEEGALHIEFYEGEACSKAVNLLKKHGYRILDSRS